MEINILMKTGSKMLQTTACCMQSLLQSPGRVKGSTLESKETSTMTKKAEDRNSPIESGTLAG